MTPLKFEDSPEAQTYLKQLEAGEIQLPASASSVEKTVLKKLKETVAHMRSLAQNRAQTAQQIERLKQQHFEIGVEEDKASGTLTGFAQLLATAEGERREVKAAKDGEDATKKPTAKTTAKPTPKAKPSLKVAEKQKAS